MSASKADDALDADLRRYALGAKVARANLLRNFIGGASLGGRPLDTAVVVCCTGVAASLDERHVSTRRLLNLCDPYADGVEVGMLMLALPVMLLRVPNIIARDGIVDWTSASHLSSK